MKEEMIFENQIDLTEADSNIFEKFTLVTDFQHVKTLNSSSAPEAAKSVSLKISKSVKEILEALCKKLSSTSGVNTSSTLVIRNFTI